MFQKLLLSKSAFLSVLLLLFSSSSMASDSLEDPRDPYEPFNRAIWDFNYNMLDKPIYRPIAHSYLKVPYGVREALNNFMRNLEEPASFVNHLLQLEFKEATHNALRFSINSTVGLFGLIDVMGEAGLEGDPEEFSDVLGYYGFSEGAYLMLPAIGPSTVREEVGGLVDSLYGPAAGLSFIESLIVWGVDGVYKRSSVIDQEPLLDNSLDSYNFLKDAYLQYRLHRFYNGNPPLPDEQDVDNFDFEIDDYMDELDGY